MTSLTRPQSGPLDGLPTQRGARAEPAPEGEIAAADRFVGSDGPKRSSVHDPRAFHINRLTQKLACSAEIRT
jgi:hypothetical protein